jgi:hypothetical protein
MKLRDRVRRYFLIDVKGIKGMIAARIIKAMAKRNAARIILYAYPMESVMCITCVVDGAQYYDISIKVFPLRFKELFYCNIRST